MGGKKGQIVEEQKHTMEFVKYSATGNDFILIEDLDQSFPAEDHRWIAALCRRRTGIGADGLILIQKSMRCDFRMRYFNADGHEAEMCGNGARAALHFAHQIGMTGRYSRFESLKAEHEGQVQKTEVGVRLQPPSDDQDVPLEIWEDIKEKLKGLQGTNLAGLTPIGHVKIGVPHFVLKAENLRTVPVEKLGPVLAHHAYFPAGTNVNFIQVSDRQNLQIRTFERGVEAETLSCGTGAAASAFLGWRKGLLDFPVKIQARGGKLTVDFDTSTGSFWLWGPVVPVYSGRILLKRTA
jgi:diaminopimelate epimerase